MLSLCPIVLRPTVVGCFAVYQNKWAKDSVVRIFLVFSIFVGVVQEMFVEGVILRY